MHRTNSQPQVYISSQFLDDIQSNIRVRPIPWEGYVRANLLSASDAGLIKSIEKQTREKRLAIVEKEVDNYSATIMRLLKDITREDVVKYLLCLTSDLMSGMFAEFVLSDFLCLSNLLL